MRRPIINPASQDSVAAAVNRGAVPQGAVAPAAIPFDESTWDNVDVPFADAKAMAAIPALANNEVVLQFKAQEAAAGQFAANEERTRVARETADFEQEAFNPNPVQPVFSGQGDINDTFNTAASGQQTVAPSTEARPTFSQLGPDGMPLPTTTVDQLAREEFVAQGQRDRQNNFATRINAAEDLDNTLKYDYGIGDLTRSRVVEEAKSLGTSFVNTTTYDPKVENSEAPVIQSLMQKTNAGFEQDLNNVISPSAFSVLSLQALVRDSKILSGKGNKTVSPDANLFEQLMDSSGFTAIDTGDTGLVAFHTQQGLIGIQEGSLGRRQLKQIGESIKQARGSDTEASFDSADAASYEEALIESGLLVPGKFTVLNEKGLPSTKREELGKEHSALFMTRKLFDLVRGLNEFSEKTTVKADVQRYTDGSGKSFPEFEGRLRAKPFNRTRPSKELKEKTSGENIFTSYYKKYSSAFRRHDMEVVSVQALLSSALSEYIRTPPNRREQLPENTVIMAEAYAQQVKISPEELALIDSSSLDPDTQKRFFNANRKIQNGGQLIASAAVTQIKIPTGHYVGAAVRVDPSTLRGYNMTAASNEQNSKDSRGSLKGHDRVISRKLIEGKSGSQRVIDDRTYSRFRSFIERDPSIKLDANDDVRLLDETAFMISVMRRFYPGSKTIPDKALIKEFTVQDIKNLAELNSPLKQLSQMVSTNEQNVELLKSNPEKTVLDTNALGQIDSSKLANALGFMMKVDPKSSGQQQQVISFLDKYVNATGNTVTGAILSLPDLSSGSRVQASIYAGFEKGSQLVTNMGFMQDTAAAFDNDGNIEAFEGVNYTRENPRMMAAKSFRDRLGMMKDDFTDSMEGDSDGQTVKDIAKLFTTAMNTTEAPEYMDSMFKLGNMVLDYGMGILGSTDAIINDFDNMLNQMTRDPNLAQAVASFRETYPDPAIYYDIMSSAGVATLLEVANLGFSQSLSGLAQASLMLGESISLVGYDNSLFTVGNIGRTPIYGESRVIRSSLRDRTVQQESELGNNPGAAAESTFVDGAWSRPLPFSAQMQAAAPFIGHNFERSSLLTGLGMADSKLGEAYSKDIILDGHDSLGLSPLRAIQQEHYVNTKAVKKVLNHKLPVKTFEHIENSVKAIMQEVLSNPTVTMGQGSSTWAPLGLWFDMKFAELIREDSLEFKGNPSESLISNRKKRLLKDKNMLKQAQDAGLWSPDANTLTQQEAKKGRNVLGTAFTPEDKHRQGTFSVKSDLFARWYFNNIFKPARQKASTELSNFGGDFNRLVDTITDPSKVSFASWYK